MSTTLRLHNTLTRQLEAFASIEPDHVRLYTCGPTVYDYAHIGNLRTFLFEDILRRTLQLFGWRVTQVMNLTDVDDKTIRNANEAGTSLRTYTDRFAEAFFEDLGTLRVEPAEHYPRATDYIDEMVEIVQSLTERGHTYTSDGSIYYRISTFPEYGKLSGISLEGNIAGARIDADEYEKDDARDFVLWKGSRPGEPSWDTPIGAGRPGWHLECSAMSMALLGESFDIHTGAVDNIFPHHENEIAQSEGATGRPFARFWLHAEHLIVEGEKMAKSKGNFFTLRDLLEQGHDPAAIRYLLISVPYRQKLNFTFDGLHAAAQAIERISNTQRRLEHSPAATDAGDLPLETVSSFFTELEDALGDDLNTARALAAVHTLLRAVNTALDGNGIAAASRAELERAFATIDATLGIAPQAAGETGDTDAAEIDALVAERTQARAERQFDRADAIRDELRSRGIVLEDTPHGTVWHRDT
jgi:cysteinyl-tRNA synthetase